MIYSGLLYKTHCLKTGLPSLIGSYMIGQHKLANHVTSGYVSSKDNLVYRDLELWLSWYKFHVILPQPLTKCTHYQAWGSLLADRTSQRTCRYLRWAVASDDAKQSQKLKSLQDESTRTVNPFQSPLQNSFSIQQVIPVMYATALTQRVYWTAGCYDKDD